MLQLLRIVATLFVSLLVFGTISVLLISPENAAVGLGIMFGGPIVLIVMIERYYYKKRKVAAKTQLDMLKAADRREIREVFVEHYSAVSRNFRRAVEVNDYGAVVRDDRGLATVEFLESVGVRLQGLSLTEAAWFIQNLLEDEENRMLEEQGFDLDSLPKDGLEFEDWAARALRIFGWDAVVTVNGGAILGHGSGAVVVSRAA